jgi:hypothetical protein
MMLSAVANRIIAHQVARHMSDRRGDNIVDSGSFA